MPIVTALEQQQHDRERLNVYLDNAFGFGAAQAVVLAHGLHVGREVTQEEIASILDDDGVERAFGAALNFLSFRPRSRREIRDYFRRKKVETPVADAVVQRLERSGLLDDREFARFWVDNRQSFRPRGTRALRMEMRQKGLENEIIDEALEGLGDEVATAYEAGVRKAHAYQSLDDREFVRKMVGFLQRRGFPYSAASAAARRLAEERDLSDVDDVLPILEAESEA